MRVLTNNRGPLNQRMLTVLVFVLLLAVLAQAQRTTSPWYYPGINMTRTERGDFHRRLRHAELDEELLDGLGTALREHLVVGGRTMAVGVAGDQHGPRLRAGHGGRRVLQQLRGIRAEAHALEVEVDVGVGDRGVGRGHAGLGLGHLGRLDVARLRSDRDAHEFLAMLGRG